MSADATVITNAVGRNFYTGTVYVVLVLRCKKFYEKVCVYCGVNAQV